MAHGGSRGFYRVWRDWQGSRGLASVANLAQLLTPLLLARCGPGAFWWCGSKSRHGDEKSTQRHRTIVRITEKHMEGVPGYIPSIPFERVTTYYEKVR